MLTLTNVQIVYDNTIEAVREASLTLGPHQIVALLGANGAGKSTTLKAISGVLYPEDGEVKGGQITFEGQPLTGMTPDRIVRAGVVMVPEGRRLFDQLTVEENLLMGGYTRSVAESRLGLERVYATFPRLTPKRATVSGYLSGGEQQMVAIGRALMSPPKLLMLDEPTLGWRRRSVEEIFAIIQSAVQAQGAEHPAGRAERAAARWPSPTPATSWKTAASCSTARPTRCSATPTCASSTLAVRAAARTSMKDVKHYKRRKRWLS
jgi:branched-chain amino acid transport system ATP-binding protein